MDRSALERLVGACILISLLVMFIPMLLKGQALIQADSDSLLVIPAQLE